MFRRFACYSLAVAAVAVLTLAVAAVPVVSVKYQVSRLQRATWSTLLQVQAAQEILREALHVPERTDQILRFHFLRER